jgi:RIO kinase 2
MDIAEAYSKISKNEWRVLNTIFQYMWDYEYVPVELIAKKVGFNEEKTKAILKALAGNKIVTAKQLSYFGATFTFFGLSLYSLRRFVKKRLISMIGNKMGEGKESTVYNAISERYGEVILKFHRVGYPSFKKVREKRDYGDLHFTVLTVRSARNEFRALKRLAGFVSVPKPYGWEGNAVMIELIEAKELFKVKLTNAEEVLDMLIDEVKAMYERGVVHGDLSQYNILVSEEGIWIIDFPQAIVLEEESEELSSLDIDELRSLAEELLERDLRNILDYFKRSYGINRNLEEVIKYIRQ